MGKVSDSLKGRVILVTGATGGLGSALCEAVSARGAELILAGRKVLKLERLADRLEAAGGPEPVLYPVDLAGAGPDDYATMAAAIGSECGRLDAVVHLAAEFGGLTPLANLDPGAWQTAFQVNVHAVFLINQAVHPLLKASAGRVIMTLDDPDRVGGAYWGPYGSGKFALRGLLQITAAEWEADEVGVYGVIPEPARTRLRGNAYMQETVSPAEPADAIRPFLELLDFEKEVETGKLFGPA